ncbi:MAG: hypothetical protein WCK77_10960 [Verrucomicrobiota bacterium]
MNPVPYIKTFAWLSIVALSCSIFSDYWVPMLIGAALVTLFYKMIKPR